MGREAVRVIQGGEAPPDLKIRALLERAVPEPHPLSIEGRKFIADITARVSVRAGRNKIPKT